MAGAFRDRIVEIEERLANFSKQTYPLMGIPGDAERRVCAEQVVSSIRRIEYVKGLLSRKLSACRADANDHRFDPLMAAVLRSKAGDYDEAWWLTFIATHFGKHEQDGWRLARDFYGAFGAAYDWDWATISEERERFNNWIEKDWPTLLNDGISRRFSNHRKFESKKASNLSSVINSYIDWVQRFGDHRGLMVEVHKRVGQNPIEGFDELYRMLGSVKQFGRLGSFDFLTMLGKLGLAPIEPGRAYLKGATGPLAGAKLLVAGDANANYKTHKLEEILVKLGAELSVGQQVMEDALCNWQKSPNHYLLFRG